MISTRTGAGPPLVLVHGLGSTPRAWDPILAGLTARHEVIRITLPGHDGAPAEADSGTFAGLMRSLDAFIVDQGLGAVPLVGSSLGARMVLEMARRGHRGATVALDPGGFWKGWERTMFKTTLTASVGLLRGLGGAVKPIARTAAGRTLLLAQLSAHPWRLDGKLVASELAAFAATPTALPLVRDLAAGPPQEGPAGPGAGPVTIGWGRHDRLCLGAQAERARTAFPDAAFHWFDHSGHFPMWDEPAETLRLILAATQVAEAPRGDAVIASGRI
ncbi:alpha/beta fold hydrolase [Sphingomonas sinipercae]|uniref:Alpha/beta fold hydrolase n=1 Tax=Sphingomonas sinipercae TaxID=2714944 RepID=A0A6G7ZQI9_9SPHN|nr:alpha/beta fold hydrolase [Sphingomonas sinipercae]QIL03182.1 alpha/beta fold hydrolase [Sphingomonas sinipercae]